MAWKHGQSGNPSGRKPGKSENTKLRESITSAVPDIITMLVEQAKGGDVGAARLLLERALPPIKAVEMPVPLALEGTTLTEKGRAVLDAIAGGADRTSTGGAVGYSHRATGKGFRNRRTDGTHRRTGATTWQQVLNHA